MKYNYYVYLPRIGTILVMFLTCSALFSKEIFFNIIYLVFVVLFSQILFIYEKRLLKNNEPQYEKISFRDSLLMYPILLKIELFLFAIVSLFSILILLCHYGTNHIWSYHNYYFTLFQYAKALVNVIKE